jgi:hypothetical protein
MANENHEDPTAAEGKLDFLMRHPVPRRVLGHKATMVSFAEMLGVARKTLIDQRDSGRLSSYVQGVLAEKLKFRLDWPQWLAGTAEEFRERYLEEHRIEAETATSPPPSAANLDSQWDGKSWSLIESLCSIILFGNQDGRTDLDFELTGQPTSITITDETGREILLQRDVVVKHCIVELHLGGAEIHGGLTALKGVVASFLRRPDARHLMIDVGGSARAPRLIVQVREGAIGIARPLLGSPSAETGEAQSACYLVEVQPGAKVTALVRIYGAELQDQEPANEALSSPEGDEGEPAIAQKRDRPLAADDRVRIMMHLWKLARSAERDPDRREPGVLVLSYDARTFVERKFGRQ